MDVNGSDPMVWLATFVVSAVIILVVLAIAGRRN